MSNTGDNLDNKAYNTKMIAALKLAFRCFRDDDIAMYGVRNDRGSDYYCCPSCHQMRMTQGYSNASDSLGNAMDHKADCRLIELRDKIRELFPESE